MSPMLSLCFWFAFPAKAAIHRAGARAADKWVPAFAGNAELNGRGRFRLRAVLLCERLAPGHSGEKIWRTGRKDASR